MTDVIAPTIDARQGEACVAFARRADGATIAREVLQRDPLRVLFPTAFDDPLPQAVIVNTAGGIVGGDRLAIAITAGAGTAARVTTPAAERIYRSAGALAEVATRLRVGPGGWLEWLPNETIVFDGPNLRRDIAVDAAPDAGALICEMIVFGRLAHGETLTHGAFRDRWRVAIGGALVWADAFALSGDIAARRVDPFILDGANAMATILAIGAGIETRLGSIRERTGMLASAVAPGLVLMRGLDDDPVRLRRAVAGAVAALRADQGLPAQAPSTWRF